MNNFPHLKLWLTGSETQLQVGANLKKRYLAENDFNGVRKGQSDLLNAV